jgi:hypothetical protein
MFDFTASIILEFSQKIAVKKRLPGNLAASTGV